MPRAANCTARNPNVIDRIVVSTEPMTEKNPFTAHAHATYSSPWSVEPRRPGASPNGMNMPRQKPSGRARASATTTRTARLCRQRRR